MTAITDPNLSLNYGWEYEEDYWNEGMDDNLKKIGAILHLTIDSFVSALPGSPTDGDRYVLTSGTHADDIAVRVAGVWEYYTPSVGWELFESTSQTKYVFTSSGWIVTPTFKVNTQSSTSYTILDSDNDGKTYIRMTNSSANTVQIETLLTNPLSVSQRGSGATTLVAGSGVTLNGSLTFTAQHQTKTIMPIGSGVYDVVG